MEFQAWYLKLISFFFSNRWLHVVLNEKFFQQYPVNAGVSRGSILGPTFFLLRINDLLYGVICIITICIDDATHYSKCDQLSELWQQLELVSELESVL